MTRSLRGSRNPPRWTPPDPPDLRNAFASPDSKQRYVRRLFSTIADRYDLITILLSFGLDRGWKRRMVSLAGALSGKRTLDLACGTGDIAYAFAGRGASVVGLDITRRMVEIAIEKGASRVSVQHPASRIPHSASRSQHPAFLVGDMMGLPFANAEFDIVTTGYGLRNVPGVPTAIKEIHRVLRPGGVLVSLDFNRPSNRIVRAAYLGYLSMVGAVLGWTLHRDPDTYRYIPESIRRYPGAQAVAEMMEAEGFAQAEWLPVLGGLMAIHVARK